MDTNTTIFKAVLLHSFPELGFGIIAKDYAANNMANIALAFLPYTTSPIGAQVANAYPINTNVLCISEVADADVCYIIGPAASVGSDTDSFANSLFYRITDFAAASATTNTQIIEALLKAVQSYLRNNRHGADGDIYPGDFDASDKNGLAGFHVGRLVATLRGASMALVDCSNITQRVRILGKDIELHTLLHETSHSTDLSAENYSVTAAEALGSLDGEGAEEDKENDAIKPKVPEALPFHRLQRLAGAAAFGEESAILEPKEDTDLYEQGAEPSALYRGRTDTSGKHTQASAMGVGLFKTPKIATLLQAHGTYQDEEPPQELRTPFDLEEPEQENNIEYSLQDDELISEKGQVLEPVKEMVGEYGALRQRIAAATAGLHVSKEDSMLSERMKDGMDQIGGVTEDQEYGLPQTITLTDPQTGETRTYYASESWLSMEPDGSILISDGYGSEIRMCRGNIYISSALDTFIRPGRDLIAMSGRNAVTNAQGTITNSAADSVFVHAAKNMKLASATSGEGLLGIECRTKKLGTTEGLIIRSNADLAVVGHDLYIGRNEGTSDAAGKVTAGKPGALIIDSGENGVLYARGASAYVDTSTEITLVAAPSAKGAFISLTPAACVVGTGMYTVGSIMTVSNGSYTAQHMTTDGWQTVTAAVAVANIIVSGSVAIEQDCTIDGSVECGGSLVAAGVASTSGEMGALQNYTPGDNFPDDVAPDAVDFGGACADIIDVLRDTVYQDYYVVGNEFAFPEYGYTSEYTMRGMRWQSLGPNKNQAGTMWKEPEVPGTVNPDDVSMCYPGKDAWQNGTITVLQEPFDAGLLDNYTINAKKTEE